MNHVRSIAAILIMLGMTLLAPVSHAGVLSTVGDSFSVVFSLADGATDPNGNTNNTGETISAEVSFELTAFDALLDLIDLTVTSYNTTGPNDDEIGLYRVGFGIDPDANSLTFIDADDDGLTGATLSAFPAFPDSALIDITTSTGPGGPRTLQAGESDTMVLRIGFADLLAGSSITIHPINVFFQSDPDSFQLGEPPISVPAPSSLMLILLGLLGIGFSRVRRGWLV